MIGRISDWLTTVSDGRVTLACLALFLLFSALVLPGQSSRAGASTGDVGSPDMTFFYSSAELYEWAAAYGDQGRADYIRARFTFDLVWPLVYGLFLITALSWLTSRAIPPAGWWRRTNLVPLLGVLCDYLENLATSLVMVRYPESTVVIDSLAGILTLLKWSLLGVAFALLPAALIRVAWCRWRPGAHQ